MAQVEKLRVPEIVNSITTKPSVPIFQLPEPDKLRIEAVREEKLNFEKAVQFAFDLECLAGVTPNPEFRVEKMPPYYEIQYADGHIKRYVSNLDSASIGLIITPWDKAVDLYGNPRRLQLTKEGDVIFWQMGKEAVRLALASRAQEFLQFHNEAVYEYLRSLVSGDLQISKRSNTQSLVIEKLLDVIRDKEGNMIFHKTAATQELGYTRIFSDREMSRKKPRTKGLILNSVGVPSSLFAIGGMPPVSGFRDVLVTAAMSFMRSDIPRNSIFVKNPDLQIKLFQQAKEAIESYGLPKDIEKIVIAQIGISVGCEDPKQIAKDVLKFKKAGCSSVRIYTTNTDYRTVETARRIREVVGEDFTICVGPIVDLYQAKQLVYPNIGVNILLAGHGGGENCTSLAGGGTANSLELLYSMYLDPDFNNTAIGLEGGTGDEIGALLGMLDVISLNRRGIAGGIETGGLFVEHTNGKVAQPYHGSASAITLWKEAVFNPYVARSRFNNAGRLEDVEGKPNYTFKPASVNSVVEDFADRRMFVGRALADQDVQSIGGLRENISVNGHNHRIVTSDAAFIAAEHRNGK